MMVSIIKITRALALLFAPYRFPYIILIPALVWQVLFLCSILGGLYAFKRGAQVWGAALLVSSLFCAWGGMLASRHAVSDYRVTAAATALRAGPDAGHFVVITQLPAATRVVVERPAEKASDGTAFVQVAVCEGAVGLRGWCEEQALSCNFS